MHSITDVIKHFKKNWTEELSETAITEACCEAGMTWSETLLSSTITIQIFFVQILHGNTAIEHLSYLRGHLEIYVGLVDLCCSLAEIGRVRACHASPKLLRSTLLALSLVLIMKAHTRNRVDMARKSPGCYSA